MSLCAHSNKFSHIKFVNFERLEDAVTARKALNGREILGAEVGSVRIGFAKVPGKVIPSSLDDSAIGLSQYGVGPLGYAGAQPLNGAAYPASERQMPDGGTLQDHRSNLFVNVAAAVSPLTGPVGVPPMQTANGSSTSGGISPAAEATETATADTDEWKMLMRELSENGPEADEHVRAVEGKSCMVHTPDDSRRATADISPSPLLSEPRKPTMYYTSIPLGVLNDPRLSRRYTSADAPRLRDIRKRLDGPTTADEVDAIAYELLEECVALSSDYIGESRSSYAMREAITDPDLQRQKATRSSRR